MFLAKTKLHRRPELGRNTWGVGQTANFVGVVAGSGMILLVGAFVLSSMITVENTNAATSNSAFSVKLDEVITLSAPSTVNLTDCNPSTSNLCTANADITVSSNFANGYNLYMNAASGSPTALTNDNTTPASTIPTLNNQYTSANFPVNSWGYTGGTDQSGESGGYNCASNYCPILAYNSDETAYAPNRLIASASEPTAATTKTITFGAKVNTSKTSGTYVTSVVFTAVGTPAPTPTMQNFDTTACANATTDETIALVDARDNKEYTVAKLQDGNCWMTQNLALGSSSPTTLTPNDSNVSSNFTLPASVAEGDWTGSYDSPEFFDYAGNYDDTTTKYGNFYNWPAATAGTGTSAVTSGDVSSSICPKNWRLPSASTAATTSEFYTMLNPYITTGSWSSSYWSGVTTSNFTNAPVSLVFSGGYYGGLDGQGDDGNWWSSTAYNGDDAHNLYVDSDGNVDPRSNYYKDYGFSVRCLVPGA